MEKGDYQYDRGDKNKPRPTLSGAVKQWPTPAARDYRSEFCNQKTIEERNNHSRGKTLPWVLAHGGTSTRQTHPTPTKSMMTTGDMEHARFSGNDPKRPKYSEVNKQSWTTPCSNDTAHRRSKYAQGGTALSTQVQGQLNPTWEEWLMNWPLFWTSLKPINDERFYEWLVFTTGQNLFEVARGHPFTPRTANGITARASRIKAIGAGQVPICAATAWRILSEGIPNE